VKRSLLVILGFAAVTIVLTWFWTEWGRLHYGNFLKVVAPPIYDAIGFGDARVGAYRQRYINFVPFAGLVLVTPGIALRRRAVGLGLGLFALFVGHLALNLTERVHKGAHLPFVPSLVSDALPFVFWIIVAYPVVSEWFAATIAQPSTAQLSTTRSAAADAKPDAGPALPADYREPDNPRSDPTSASSEDRVAIEPKSD
jgi:hypothetical protein